MPETKPTGSDRERYISADENQGYLRELYEITSNPDIAFDEKVDALFDLGCDRFGLESGGIARTKPSLDLWELESTTGTHPALAPETQVNLSETYCRLVADSEDPVGVFDPVREGFEDAKCYEEFGMESYLGTRLELDDDLDRTFFFVSTERRDRSFSEAERTFHHLMGEWVRKELQRKHREEQLRRQNERLESFANMLAHELRNPLTIAQMYHDAAVGGDETAAAEVREAHDRIEEMIDILLVTASGTDANVDREDVALSDAATDAWTNVSVETADLVVETDRTIRADKVHLQHFFENLFQNAVEHCDEAVTVRIGSIPTGFYVADDGPGVPESERDAVFEAGYTTDADGFGLGLTFIEQLVDTYGWNVTLTESEADGARFEFTDVDLVSSV